MKRRIAIATATASVAAALVAPVVALAGPSSASAAGGSVCINATVNINGTQQGIDRCLP